MRVVDGRVERNIDVDGTFDVAGAHLPPFLCWGRRGRGVYGIG